MARSSSRGKATASRQASAESPNIINDTAYGSTIISSSPSPPIRSVIVVASSTPARGSKNSPVTVASSRSSVDSFPALPPFTKATEVDMVVLSPIPKVELNAGPPAQSSAHRQSLVIQDSDEENCGNMGSDSDSDSFPDLARFVPLFRGSQGSALKTEAPSSSNSRAGTPPLTKRRANTLLTSPLPLRRAKQARVSRQPDPPKHKFDMKALMRHAHQEDATEAAARRVTEVLAESEKQMIAAKEDRKRTTEKLQLLESFIDDGADDALSGHGKPKSKGDANEGAASFNKDRLKKAFDRAEVGAVSESWYFFKEYFVPSPIKRRQFPQKAAAPGSRWEFLQDATMRQDYFTTGIVRRALQNGGGGGNGGGGMLPSSQASQRGSKETRLPDDLFVWILNEAFMESLPSLRAEYAAVLQCCPDQVRRFVDAERLVLLFQKLGPRWESIDLSTRLELVPTIHSPYPGRDWAPLRSLLHLVATLAGHLSLETVSCAVQILLRLGVDRVIEGTPDLLQEYQEAMRKLAERVPSADWSDFCCDVGASLQRSIQKPSLRWQVLACLPLDTLACHDLRRRLAAVLLFDDPERARQDPRWQLAQGLSKLVIREGFLITQDTNYIDLSALVNILDAYVDDGGRDAVLYPAAPLSKENTAARDFDADIDELARRLKVISRGIEAAGGGHISRLESKTALERVHIRLTHTARSRRPGKRNIFGKGTGVTNSASSSVAGDADASIRPKQQDIRSFFLHRLGKKAQQ
ncbi:hypothetical protein F503_00917 [Ophiostoma piceae UAMH 11346]|uniref:Uncharacterized protein n=1 Tax=Ophiostoma piceae (strain UAMH 11346) TaxID=1262450 RepID=S3C3N8_OPHP1|nr:hypothetical protein F503_00917 [Ophiostoma piceae UAMH 11346]